MIRSFVWVRGFAAAVLGSVVLAGCGGGAPAEAPPQATVQATEVPAGAFGLSRAEVESHDGRPAALLTFSAPLAGAQKFDELLAVTGDGGAAADGSWALDADGKRLRFPYLDADKTYRIRIRAALAAADGATLGKDVERELYTGPLEPLAGFASQGSVLPSHETRGLPVVTVNVPELDLEFLRIRDAELSRFLADYTRNGRRSYWSLDTLARYGDSVYANRFAIDAPANQRTLSYIPVRDIAELKAPGIYFAVMRRPGKFTSEFDTAMFFVSDLGLHVRAYGDGTLVHVASLETGEPRANVALTIRNPKGETVAETTSDGDGLARFEGYRVQSPDLLLASFGRDVSVVAFNQPALDLSEFAIAGRPQRDAEIFPWSGRDLYRPGETLRVAAILRDHDGRAMPPQPLFATLRQPDGRALGTTRLEPGELGYVEFARDIAVDAPTGRWSLEFATDPAAGATGSGFAFRVEEFLPERLKLDLASSAERLKPGEPLPLAVEAAYLYGAPAGGNRFTARISVGNDDHPVAALADFHFGDPLADLPKGPRDVLDETLDAEGRIARDLEPLGSDVAVTGPVAVTVAGSVYETGGRAVSRTLKRTIWPADALIGMRPLFTLADGATPWGDARFEVVRSDAAGTLLAGTGLKVRFVRERRDYRWTHDPDIGWRMDYTQRFEVQEERSLDIEAGGRAQLAFPVEWGGYRLEIEDPETGLVARLPFEAGWSSDDQNQGEEARPDKVKLALDRTGYRGGESLRVTVTPPHPGPALLLLEGDGLLWHKTVPVQSGTEIEIPLQPEWERHDLYLTALVFRPGSVAQRITPKRAVGVVHVPMAREDRRVAVSVETPETMRPQQPMTVAVSAPAFAGQTARVRVTAVDLGVLNITRFPLPDAAAWFFAQRRFGIDLYDLYGRVIESLDGERARLRYGGDAALAAVPSARRPNTEIRTVDLFHAPVALDAAGKATVQLPVPDFNGTLRVRALVYGADRYGSGERDTVVRAPLVAEASTPRVMAPGDRSQITLDLQNLSGAEGRYTVALEASGPVAVEAAPSPVTLADQAKRTLSVPLTATGSFGVGVVRVAIDGPEVTLRREYRVAVRPAFPAVARATAEVLEQPRAVRPDPAILQGLLPDSVTARISVSTVPPLPFASALQGLIGYPYGCVEQTTSKTLPLVWLDDEAASRFALSPVPQDKRARLIEEGFARLTAMQNDSGHFGMWPGDSWVNSQMTPYVVELMLEARDAGFAVPEAVLDKALSRINEDLLSGGNGHYEYEHSEHLRLAEMAYGGYVLARVQRAPVGTLRALFDNERGSFVAPLPLVHLAVAFKLMGDGERAARAMEEAFTREFTRPDWLGDYGTALRDGALMVALAHEHGLAKPEYDATAVALARELTGRGHAESWYLSTQEQIAIFRLGRALLGSPSRTFAASIAAGGRREELTGRALVSREFTPAELAAGVSIVPSGNGPLYVSQDVAGYPRTAPQPVKDAELRIRRSWYRTDGTPFEGETLREGEVLVAHLRVETDVAMNDALVVDLVPGGLEIENLNLTDASQWQDVSIDGIALGERQYAAEIRHEEYRDDRYVAALKLWGGGTAHLFYLVRAVSPGRYTVPPPGIEDMYRPALRAVGVALPERLEVTPP